MTKNWQFRPPEWLEQRLQAYAQAHETGQTDTVIGFIEELIQKTEPGVQSSSETKGHYILPPSGQSPASPTPGSDPLTGSEPVPLGASSSLKQTASASTSMTLNSGRNVGKHTSTISIQQQQPSESDRLQKLRERLLYQQEKQRIIEESKVNTEKAIHAIREQVRRFRNTESLKRGSVEWETGGTDHGRPDFTEYERYN